MRLSPVCHWQPKIASIASLNVFRWLHSSQDRSGRRIARGLPEPHPDTKTIHAIRQCLKTRNYRQLDAELVTAWLNTVEAKQQIEAVGNELKSRTTDEN
jgi:hypothetical protein